MRLVRRLLACLLALVVLGESSGVARAFGPGSTVDCCCGEHAAARPCHCATCPVTKLRTRSTDPADGHVCPPRDCDGHTAGDPGVLRVLATPTPALPALAAPLAFARVVFAAPLPLRSRILDAGRPPP